jgi:hypothetical protein
MELTGIREKCVRVFQFPSMQKTAYAILVLLFVILWFQTLHRASRLEGYDLDTYLLSAQSLLQGKSPYILEIQFPYLYPLFLSVVLIPATWIPSTLVHFFWYFLNWCCLLVAISLWLRLMTRHLPLAEMRMMVFPLSMLLLVFLSPLHNHLTNGQINLVVLLCCMLFLYFLLHQENDPLSAIFLALAISIKIMPIVFAGFLLFRRRYACIACTVLFTILCCLILPYPFFGSDLWGVYDQYIRILVEQNLNPSASSGIEQYDYSLAGFIEARLVRHPAPPVLLSVGTLLLLTLVLELVLNTRKADLWVVNHYFLLMLLLSPVSSPHHLVFLYPAIALWMVTILYEPRQFMVVHSILFALFILLHLCSKGLSRELYFPSLILLEGVILWNVKKREKMAWKAEG